MCKRRLSDSCIDLLAGMTVEEMSFSKSLKSSWIFCPVDAQMKD